MTASQRRVQRAAEVEAIKAMAHDGLQEDELMSEDGGVSDEPESEEGVEVVRVEVALEMLGGRGR
jgi:hypothetical protein